MLLLLWIQGDAVQNATVGASLNLIDPALLAQLDFQWLVDGQPIAGATSATLTLTQAQVGRQVMLRASRPDGQGGVLTTDSNSIGPVLNLNDAPIGAVQIEGSPIEGLPLKALPLVTDPDGVGTWHYQWKADGLPIAGATASQYTPGAQQVGQVISVVLTYTDGGGQEERVVSASTAPVQNLNNPPDPNRALEIAGLAWQGLTLRAQPQVQDPDGVGPMSWQWYADGEPIAAAQSSSLLLGPGLAGRSIRLRGRYIDGGGTLETVWSEPTTPVVNQEDPLQGTVTVLGTPSVGQGLRAALNVRDPDGIGTLRYEWLANGFAIPGENSAELLVSPSLLGKTLQLRVGQTDALGNASNLTSQSTASVTALAPVLAQQVIIGGTALEGAVLTATVQLAPGASPSSTRFQWLADGRPVEGATLATLPLDASLVGQTLSVAVWCADAGGKVQSLTSASTLPVADAPSAPQRLFDMPDVQWSVDKPLLIEAITGAWRDPDGQTLTLSWRLKGGGPLPSWLQVDDDGMTLRAAAGATSAGRWVLERVASDGVLETVDEVILTAAAPTAQIHLHAGTPALTGARLFLDQNGDRQGQASEATALYSDASGRLQGQASTGGVWLLQGGTWADQGVSSPMTLSAPVGSTVIHPLTTLFQNLLDLGVDRAMAREFLRAGWNLPDTLDLLRFDPELNPDSASLDVYRAQAQLWLLAGLSGLREQALTALARTMVGQGPKMLELSVPAHLHQVLLAQPGWAQHPQASQIEARLLSALEDLEWLDSLPALAAATAASLGSLSPLDLNAPSISESDPVSGERGVDINIPLWVRFDEPIQVGRGAISLLADDTGQDIPIQWRLEGDRLIVNPVAWLNKQTAYQLLIGSGSLSDLAGNVLPEQRIAFVSSAFDPIDRAPVLLSSQPLDGQRNVPLDGTWVLQFDEVVHLGSSPIVLRSATGALLQTLGPAQIGLSSDGLTLSLQPASALQSGQAYVLDVPTGAVLDSDNNSLAATRLGFVTVGVRAGMTGTAGDDSLQGGAGNDVLVPGLGNDTVIGGDGVDVVCLPRFLSAYTINGTLSSLQAFDGEFSLRLEQVETLRFGQSFTTDIPLTQALSGAAQTQLAQLTDLYLAFFNRAPDVSGLEYWQREHFNSGRTFDRVSRDFAWSTEAQAWFPTGSDDRLFVQRIYQNCFDRDPDAGGWDYWTAQLRALGTTDLNARGSFVGRLILGAYAESSGPEDRGLLSNKHDVALYYVNRLAVDATPGFDTAINTLLDRVTLTDSTTVKAMRVIDHVFEHSGVSLTGVMNDAGLLAQLWAS